MAHNRHTDCYQRLLLLMLQVGKAVIEQWEKGTGRNERERRFGM